MCICSDKVNGNDMGLFLFCAFALAQHLAPLFLQWPQTQQFPAAWSGRMDHRSVYLS